MKTITLLLTVLLLTVTCGKSDDEVKHIELNIQMPDQLGEVLMSEQAGGYVVQVPIGGSSSAKHPEPDVSSLNLQVWLLKTDGSLVPQRDKPGRVTIFKSGFDFYYMIYTFQKAPLSEISGVVVRVKEKLYCREIASETEK